MWIDNLGRMLRRIPNWIPGRSRLMWYLGRLVVNDGSVSFRVKDVGYSVPSLKEPVAFGLWSGGSYEQNVQNLILSHWKKGTTFVDVGANIGSISIPLSMELNSGAVIGIEASPSIFSYLQKNIQQNHCENIEIINCAACDQENVTLEFNEAPDLKFGMGSLGTSFGTPPVSVKGRTLDGILIERGWPEVSVMKVDVEGFEAAVFLGAMRLLKEQRPVIIFEFCDWAEENSGRFPVGKSQLILRELGYKLQVIDSFNVFDIDDIKRKGYANMLAVPNI